MPGNEINALIEALKTKSMDMLERIIPYFDGAVHICYIGQLTDRSALSQLVIRPITEYCAVKKRRLSASFTEENLIYLDQLQRSDDLRQVEAHILNGWAVLLFSNDKEYLAVNCKKVESRPVDKPELMYSMRGGRDAFVENLDTNLSLLRYRLKDGNLRVEKKEVGERTKSTVAVVYLEDIARPELIAEVLKRIDSIRTDGIIDSGDLENFLRNKSNNLFPQVGILERSDMAVEALLEGRVAILVDGSCHALQAPKVFVEFMYSSDDRYDNKFFGFFMRIIRYLALFIAGTATSVYIALADYHTDALPASYIINFAQMRARAPFSAFIAVLTIEFIIELMREALLRVPVKVGNAIAIVGSIIIGQAASSSGFYSPLLLILVAIGFLSTFAMPDISLSNVMRLIKFFMILMTGFFGFYGFSLAVTFIIALYVSNDSFGVPYFAPWAPFNFYDFVRSLIFSRPMAPKRQQYLRNKDDTRAPQDADKNK